MQNIDTEDLPKKKHTYHTYSIISIKPNHEPSFQLFFSPNKENTVSNHVRNAQCFAKNILGKAGSNF